MRTALGRGLAVISLVVLGAPQARAATRLVLVPVTVGAGADPDPALMMALGNGLRQNPQWSVGQGEDLPALGRPTPPSVSADALAELTAKVDGAAGELASDAATATLTKVRAELV